MINYVKNIFSSLNSSNSITLIQQMIGHCEASLKVTNELSQRINLLQTDLDEIKESESLHRMLIQTVGRTVPDMLWCKDLNGKYLYANRALREGLFYGSPRQAILGYDDIQLAKRFKDMYGDSNHTFGEVCGNSDKVIITQQCTKKFLEWGKINGEDLYLEVHKAPMYNDEHTLIGTVGTGRDVTEYYLGLRKAVESSQTCVNGACKDLILREIDKYKFEG